MSLNCVEINLILSELSLEGSYIQEIIQPSYDSLALYTYKDSAKTLFICLAPGICRLHQTNRKVPKNDKPLRFMEFLRSRIKGSRILEAVQLDNNRIIRLTLMHADEQLYVYIRLWSGAANIIVTDSLGIILDVFYRRPKRGEVSLLPFEPPVPKVQNEVTKTWEIRSFENDTNSSKTFNENIDLWYAEHAATLSREALLAEARRRFESRRLKIEAALMHLEEKREKFLNADCYRHQGDLLQANLWAIQAGMKGIELQDYENNNALIYIPLDPTRKPQENAAHYYEKYKKAVSGLSDLESDIESSRNLIERLKEELRLLEIEQNPLVIHKYLRKQQTPKQQLKKKYPGLVFNCNGWTILVGRTAVENDELLRRHVKGFDMWLHTRDWPGGYVFIKNRPGKTIPLEILLDAATLALFYSKGRKAHSGDLYYTQVKHLRRAKNAKRGTVLPSNEKNISISLDEKRLKKLQACEQIE